MFCYQCEQTALGTGCTCGGVCGKSPETASAQDNLTTELVRLAALQKAKGLPPSEKVARLLCDGLFTCITNVAFDAAYIDELAGKVRAESDWLSNHAPHPAFSLGALWKEEPIARSLKSLLLFGLRGMAAYAHHAAVLGFRDERVDAFFVTGLAALAESHTNEELLGLILDLGRNNYRCMKVLDEAHTSVFGTPSPVCVSMEILPGPFIVVTGHDLVDLRQLLEQTAGTGVNVYTHGEMLPAHGYPELRRFKQLKGNFGTAWQNQQREFANLPAPILWTTNCLMPPAVSYADRVWTTGVVRYPGARHVPAEKSGKKDFAPLIAQAKELGGWSVKHVFTGINGGTSVRTGHGHAYVLSLAERILAAVKNGTIRRFLLVGGCDGARSGRNRYTQLVKDAPPDTIVLTLACGKYRFNDIDRGLVGGIPRLLDLGQCNDAYGVIKVAEGLAKGLGCGVNDLPLTIELTWYEQKAVAVLITLLALGIRGIRLGPTAPAFLAPEVRALLKEKLGLVG